MNISDFAYGYLYAESQRRLREHLNSGHSDLVSRISDVPSDASEFREYEDYDLNFWYDEDEDRWHCTAYDDNQRNIQLW